MRVILLGPPGSGKGTQAALLIERLSVPQISTGDLFRKNIAEKTELGRKAQEYMAAGKLVPDELVLDMVKDRLTEADAADGFILDGFPRTIPQAEGLDRMLTEGGMKLDHVVVVNVADEEIVERLSARRTCSECGAIYHMIMSPPAQADVCDKCGKSGTLSQREDDVPDTIRQRLLVYHQQTEPLIEYFGSAGLVRSIDGSQAPSDVSRDVIAAVSN